MSVGVAPGPVSYPPPDGKTGDAADAYVHQPFEHRTETAMTLLGHLSPPTVRSPFDLLRRPPHPAAPRSQDRARPRGTALPPDVDPRVFAVQRLGAVGVGLVLLVFGLLGATGGVGLLSTHGERYLGMSSNGLLSALSLVVAAVLLGAALRGPRTASTVMIVLGVLFLLSALLNLALLRTP